MLKCPHFLNKDCHTGFWVNNPFNKTKNKQKNYIY